ncbi:MAG: DnaJ domain-containing protein [Gammaproteobacteria bacterium]|nr:DnaJ domain-containing protein [Gammaproteobacteria bacterium]MCW8957710.1 DnaJ domain-containing protein [Gammaproteobacteria bacterium]MCW8972595.1 DnaJ domain-containing protein [Gammaproteobacteria bacterium]MCW8992563.1 DnaJ domain-containing protein [Gammaproteobacteria bacterium]
MEYKDYYKILGIDRNASQGEIKRAYKKLARKYHPDVSKEADAETRFKEINEAYHALKDPQKRKAYDELGSRWKQGQEFHPPPDWEAAGGGFRPEDLHGFSDFFAEIFGGGSPERGFHFEQRNFRVRGQDLHAAIEISLEDAFHGGSRTLSLQAPDIDEQGRVTQRTRQLNVQIPKGVREGQQIRLSGQGAPGLGGGQAGDLYLEVKFAPHPLFHADGRDIFLELPITPWEAALGTRLDIPTLGGRVEMNIPPGSQSGRKLRLKGRGLPGNPPGDQFLVLRIETPPADSEEARALYRRMADTLPYNPRKKRGI